MFPLLASAAIGAIGSGISAYGKYRAAKANKPQRAMRQRAFKQRANTGYLKRYMADLRGRSANRARTELAMRPALRAIGAQQQQGQRQLAYQAAQQGLEGSGIEAQKQLALQQGTTQATAGLGEKVLNQQLTQARQMQAQKEGQRMKLAGEIARQEGAVADANRMAQFRASEANRQADHTYNQQMEQYNRNVANAQSNIGLSMLGGALQGATPGLTKMASDWQTAGALTPKPGTIEGMDYSSLKGSGYTGESYDALVAARQAGYTDDDNWYGAKGGKVTKDGIAQYRTGGYVYEDVSSAVPGIATAEEELKKTKQTEYDTQLADYEKRKTAFETAEDEKVKKKEDANLLAQQKFEQSEAAKLEADKERFKTAALQNIEDTKAYDATEAEKQNQWKQYRAATEAAEQSPEYFEASKKAEILTRWGLGDKQFAKAGKQYEKVKDNFESFEDYLDQVTKDPNANVEDLFGEGISANKKKRLLKKYNKKMDALLPKFEEETATDRPTMDFERTAPGEAPTKQEYTAKEFTEEAPTLAEPTEKELYKLRRKEIFKQLQAGIDVAGNIKKAQTNREAVDFFKQVGNMSTDQIWSHPWAVSNPSKVATIISNQQKTQLAAQTKADKQYADREKVRDNITRSLFDIDQISASGDPITVDDPETLDVDESKTATFGEKIKGIVDKNPDGVTPDQMREILGYVDKIKAEYGDEDDGVSFEEGFDDNDPMASLKALAESGGASTKKVTRLLKELLKLPILPAEGMLAEEIDTKGKVQKLGDLPKGKVQKLGDLPKGEKIEEFTW